MTDATTTLTLTGSVTFQGCPCSGCPAGTPQESQSRQAPSLDDYLRARRAELVPRAPGLPTPDYGAPVPPPQVVQRGAFGPQQQPVFGAPVAPTPGYGGQQDSAPPSLEDFMAKLYAERDGRVPVAPPDTYAGQQQQAPLSTEEFMRQRFAERDAAARAR